MFGKIRKWMDSTGSKPFSKASKLCLLAGAAIIVLSLALQFVLPTHFNGSPVIAGIIFLAGGLYFRRKAKTIERRFEWREKYKVAA